MSTVSWTARAQADLAAIHAFVEADSPHFATVVVRRLLHAVERPAIREVILSPYRIVYRIVDLETIHVLTVHHAARAMPYQASQAIVDDLSELLKALATLGYELVGSRFSPESFGNYVIELASREGPLQIVRDRLQYYLGDTGEPECIAELKRAGMFRAFDDLQTFQPALLAYLRTRK